MGGISTDERQGILVFSLVATVLLLLLIVACCHRYYKLKTIRATAAMLPDWDGRQQLNDAAPLGPAYVPAPQHHTANFHPLPNVLYTGTPYHHPLPAHVQYYQQQHHMQAASRLPNASDRQDHLNATPGAYQLNQQAAMATPNVVGCFYGAAFVPTNPYGPTHYGLVEAMEAPPSMQHPTQAEYNMHNNAVASSNATPPTYDQAMMLKTGMTAVSE